MFEPLCTVSRFEPKTPKRFLPEAGTNSTPVVLASIQVLSKKFNLYGPVVISHKVPCSSEPFNILLDWSHQEESVL